ncbi:hypothetical protein C1H46_025118 [Malus baccata]|uniref:Uncharacterized protein n=1 Tax=Malus baccata TaxID=106549 RepID=A0A540LSH8_MALBA|nr:hypothetical protein C1H46_025118 [Malus baccata]
MKFMKSFESVAQSKVVIEELDCDEDDQCNLIEEMPMQVNRGKAKLVIEYPVSGLSVVGEGVPDERVDDERVVDEGVEDEGVADKGASSSAHEAYSNPGGVPRKRGRKPKASSIAGGGNSEVQTYGGVKKRETRQPRK